METTNIVDVVRRTKTLEAALPWLYLKHCPAVQFVTVRRCSGFVTRQAIAQRLRHKRSFLADSKITPIDPAKNPVQNPTSC
jgi:hypothetical protein